LTTVKTTCPYCGVGCGVLANTNPDGSVSIKGDPDHPANFGRLCSKGSALGETLSLEERLLYPEIDDRRATWNEALDLVAARFRESVETYGPDSVAFYASGQMLTEDYYAANKLMKGFIGTANIDTNSRLCMASSVAGHRRAFGSDTVPGTYEDLELADLVILVGSNLAWCHPVLYQRLAAAKEKRPHMQVVLIDPRRTMTADIADMHLPIAPDSDVALFAGLLRHIAENNCIDQTYVSAHVTGLDSAIAATPGLQDASSMTGLSQIDLQRFYTLFAATGKVVTVYSQGVNQSASGTDKVNAIINCHLATGRIGKPGAGPFSVTGQPNAMGGREVGGLANMLAAHMEIGNPQHRALVQEFWSAPRMADKPGLKAVDMFQAVADGRIRALWIMSTNPAASMPEADAVSAAIAACPFVVVSDVCARTDTIVLANVKLPATAWGEKNGTVTNSERRISRQRAFLPAPAEAMPDWKQIAEVATRMGFGGFGWGHPSDILAEHAALSGYKNDGIRDFNISALSSITRQDFDALEPFQWPWPAGETPQDRRFFGDGAFYTPDRKARAIATKLPNAVQSSSKFNYTLNTGRIRDQWHTMTRTGLSPRLSAHLAEPFCEIHPDDAITLGIGEACLVELESPYGKSILRVLITPRQRRGSVFAPMHWTGIQASAARVDALVAALTDPVSGQPALKSGAVALKPFEARWHGFAVTAERPENLEPEYWALGCTSGGWRIELAGLSTPAFLDDFARNLFGRHNSENLMVYSDRTRGQFRAAAFNGEKLIGAFFFAREPVNVSRQLACGLLQESFSDLASRWRAIAGCAGADQPDKGAIICSCFAIGANQIAAACRSGQATTIEAIGAQLSAGTNCGSCRAEIRAILDSNCLLAAE
jgi:assimilatory nitrate reductase catalytic subunit